MKFLPKKLKEARSKMKFSGEDLVFNLRVKGLSISRQTLCSWENGDTFPTVNQIAELSIILQKPVSFFFTSKHGALASGKATGGKK